MSAFASPGSRHRLFVAGLLVALAPIFPAAATAQNAAAGFVWHEVVSTASSGRVSVRFAPADSLAGMSLLARLVSQPGLPGLPPGYPPVVVAYLAPSEASFQALTGGTAPHWSAGVALPDSAVMVIPGYVSSRSAPGSLGPVVRHELAHLGLHAYLGGLRIPRWFDEGYARWAEGGFDATEAWRLRVLLALGQAPPLDSLSFDWPDDAASAEAAYLLGASAVVYLAEQSGERGVQLLLERWRATGSFEGALVRTYGLTSGRLEGEWRKWVKRRFGWLMVVTHSTLAWTGLALVLIAATAGRRRANRNRMARLRATEPAEDPAYWLEEGGGGP